MKNSIAFVVNGRYALFSDPVTRIGGEKCSTHIPTYEALKGVAKSIYWKPTFSWFIDRVRVMHAFKTQSKGVKILKYQSSGNDLSIYTYLENVAYQVEAHFEWNEHHPELQHDRIDGKHYAIAQRTLERGGRQDIFLGTRECQAYVTPCTFGDGTGAYDALPELSFGLMFHGFDYPDETGEAMLRARFWYPVMREGIIDFIRPEDCPLRKDIRPMKPKVFSPGQNFCGQEDPEFDLLLASPPAPCPTRKQGVTP